MRDPDNPFRRPGGDAFGGALSGPVPRDLAVLLGVVFITFSLQFFAATAPLTSWLRLGPAAWTKGFVWQLVTYPFIGVGGPSFWFLLELFVLYLFGRTVLSQLGRRGFWRLLVGGALLAALVAVAVQLAMTLVGSPGMVPFTLMQGQRMLLVIMVAAFATKNRHATILLFFVLPMPARLFIGLEILLAFLGFLGTKDLAGFLGICAAVGGVYLYLTPGRLRQVVLRTEERLLRLRLSWMRKKRRIRLVEQDDESHGGPWLH